MFRDQTIYTVRHTGTGINLRIDISFEDAEDNLHTLQETLKLEDLEIVEFKEVKQPDDYYVVH